MAIYRPHTFWALFLLASGLRANTTGEKICPSPLPFQMVDGPSVKYGAGGHMTATLNGEILIIQDDRKASGAGFYHAEAIIADGRRKQITMRFVLTTKGEPLVFWSGIEGRRKVSGLYQFSGGTFEIYCRLVAS